MWGVCNSVYVSFFLGGLCGNSFGVWCVYCMGLAAAVMLFVNVKQVPRHSPQAYCRLNFINRLIFYVGL